MSLDKSKVILEAKSLTRRFGGLTVRGKPHCLI
jgi:hypothetical protein